MKFKGSKLEERYNVFWNAEIVTPYNLLKNHPSFGAKNLFSANYPNKNNLMEKYCNGIAILMSNIIRQTNEFEDKEYIGAYLEEVKNIALADLKKFRVIIETSGNKMSPYMSQVMRKLGELESNVSRSEINALSQGDGNDSLMDEFLALGALEENNLSSIELDLTDPAWKF